MLQCPLTVKRQLDLGGPGSSRVRATEQWLPTCVIGVLDASTRLGALTLLPFLLTEKGTEPGRITLWMGWLFFSGAIGKFGCGPLADEYGSVVVIMATEAVTALALLGLVVADAGATVFLLIGFGFVLNGTSSVLYAAVARMVEVERRARGYELFLSFYLGANAVAPLAYGLVADRIGLPSTFAVISGITLACLTMALLLRGAISTPNGEPAR